MGPEIRPLAAATCWLVVREKPNRHTRAAHKETVTLQLDSAYNVQILPSNAEGEGEVVHHVVDSALGLEQVRILVE